MVKTIFKNLISFLNLSLASGAIYIMTGTNDKLFSTWPSRIIMTIILLCFLVNLTHFIYLLKATLRQIRKWYKQRNTPHSERTTQNTIQPNTVLKTVGTQTLDIEPVKNDKTVPYPSKDV